jgi:integrase
MQRRGVRTRHLPLSRLIRFLLVAQRGTRRLRLYDLRHAHAQWVSEAGVSEAAIGVSLRHKTAAMTRRYTKRLAKGETARRLGQVVFPSRDGDTATGGRAA